MRAGVGAAESGIVEELSHLAVSGDKPGVIAHTGADSMDCSLGLQLTQ
ncbi:hypothetical protein F0344_00440 [Streptomyces finlayi]|uniref:Uncharacterized protein n=1 Tax=Streptomyces finlayi TaxID=67296 RepID=A0A7G7BD80_9ACTN|nr:hypothetical protein [Streptomyces finlayi]QNE73295.1 hypothetical protein F0344_00440 [Streptomyces finlayi]